MNFYDTCALLLTSKEELEKHHFIISDITLEELEKIKSSASKDENVKYKARRALHTLNELKDKYTIFFYEYVTTFSRIDNESNDKKIIKCAAEAVQEGEKITFITADLSCAMIAETFYSLDVKYLEVEPQDPYCGYYELSPQSVEEELEIYSSIGSNINHLNLLTNQYLIINSFAKPKTQDVFKWSGSKYIQIPYHTFESDHFGTFKPKNVYQRIAMDSVINHDITLIGGPAGSGKTALSLAYLFSLLEKSKIDRIVVFCNPVVAKNAAKLGYYPGTMVEKLLSSQVGNVLSSKLGSMMEVENLINTGKIVLISAGDARGYETPAHSGVYIMEAQNFDSILLRMLLQRIGEECKVIVDGDRLEQTDIDIYENDNGMKKMSKVFRGEECFGQIDLKQIERSNIARIAERMK